MNKFPNFHAPSAEPEPESEIKSLTLQLRNSDFRVNFAKSLPDKTPEELLKLQRHIWKFADNVSKLNYVDIDKNMDRIEDNIFNLMKIMRFFVKSAAVIGIAKLSGAALLGIAAKNPMERGQARAKKQMHVTEFLELWQELKTLHHRVTDEISVREKSDGKKYDVENYPKFPASPTWLGHMKDRLWDHPGI